MAQNTQTRVTRARKFTTRYIAMAARAKAAGMSDEQIAYLCGVKESTLARWKRQYPEFKRSCKEGSEVATQYLISRGLQAAGGYTTEEVKVDYTIDEETGLERVTGKTVKTKDVAPNQTLLMFFLMNMAPDHFKNTREININDTKTLTVNINEGDRVKKLCGELAKTIDCKVLDSKDVNELPR